MKCRVPQLALIVGTLVLVVGGVTAGMTIRLSPGEAAPVKTLPTPLPTPTPTPIGGSPEDYDGDGVFNAVDNCPQSANANQTNSDNYIDMTPPKPFDDATWVNSDLVGDACEDDTDNDGWSDALEPELGPGGTFHVSCLAASAPTDVMKRDTDGDRVLDASECILGYDPASAASVPPLVVPPDADSDGAPDVEDPDDANSDSDGDGLRDGVEFRFYGRFNQHSANQDVAYEAVPCGDAREVASVDANHTVNAADLGLVASAFGTYSFPVTAADTWRWNMDTDKNGTVNAADLGFVAGRFGACP
jgi:hypothetical protein